MGNQKITSKHYFKTLKIIHTALVGGVIIFAIVVTYMLSGEELSNSYGFEANIFYAIIAIFALIAIFGGDFIFKSMLKKAKMHPALPSKMMHYQSACIIRYSLLEGVSLFSIVACLLTLIVWFLIIAGVLVLILASYHPNVEKTIRDLELNTDEQKQVRNPDAFISEAFNNQD